MFTSPNAIEPFQIERAFIERAFMLLCLPCAVLVGAVQEAGHARAWEMRAASARRTG
jgi:hypothetical protein